MYFPSFRGSPLYDLKHLVLLGFECHEISPFFNCDFWQYFFLQIKISSEIVITWMEKGLSNLFQKALTFEFQTRKCEGYFDF